MNKFIGTEDEGDLIGPGEKGWLRIGVITTSDKLDAVLAAIAPLAATQVVLLMSTNQTVGGHPALLLFAADPAAVDVVTKAVGDQGKVKLLTGAPEPAEAAPDEDDEDVGHPTPWVIS